jgi:hypothetical protein
MMMMMHDVLKRWCQVKRTNSTPGAFIYVFRGCACPSSTSAHLAPCANPDEIEEEQGGEEEEEEEEERLWGSWWASSDLGSHHLEELVEVDGARAVSVDVGDHLLDLLLLGLEAEGAHGDLELLGIDRAGAVGVEEVEGLADLLLLLLSEGELVSLCLLPAASCGPPVVCCNARKGKQSGT